MKNSLSTPDLKLFADDVKGKSDRPRIQHRHSNGASIDFLPFELPQLTTTQVMQLSLKPPSEPSKLHLLIRVGRWSEIRENYNFRPKNRKNSATITRSLSMSLLKASFADPAQQLLLRDEYGRTPLFLSLRRRVSPKTGLIKAPLDLIFDILSACPDAAAVPDIKNNFPLHIAVINSHRENIVRAILQCYPGAAMERNEDLDTPLILASNFSIQVKHEGLVNNLSDGKPSSMKPSDSPRSHWYTIQDELDDPINKEAFSSSKRWDLVLVLLQYKPEAACIRNRNGMSVLEMAIQRHAPSNVISALIKADKTALSLCHPLVHSSSMVIDEEYGKPKVNGVITPLSLAIRRGADDAVLRMISYAFPDALGMHDEYGLTPLSFCWLHWLYAFSQNSNVGICDPRRQDLLAKFFITKKFDQDFLSHWMKIETLLCASRPLYCLNRQSAAPVQIDDENAKDEVGTEVGIFSPGATLLNESYIVHAAAAQDCPAEILDAAILLYPSQVKEQTFDGSLPLHLAARAPAYIKQPYELERTANPIDLLSKAYPSGGLVFDDNGLLPIHVAIRSGKKWGEGLSSLVMSAPRSLLIPDPLTRLIPFMLAAYCYFPPNPVSTAILIKAQNRVGFFEWHAMTERQREIIISQLHQEEELSAVASVFALLRAAPDAISGWRKNYSVLDSKASLVCVSGTVARSHNRKADEELAAKPPKVEIYNTDDNAVSRTKKLHSNLSRNNDICGSSIPKLTLQNEIFQPFRHLQTVCEDAAYKPHPQPDLSKFFCVLCKVHPRQSVFFPCRHFCLCSSCSSMLTTKSCLVCNTKVTNVIDVIL
jgi:hypothetical protein